MLQKSPYYSSLAGSPVTVSRPCAPASLVISASVSTRAIQRRGQIRAAIGIRRGSGDSSSDFDPSLQPSSVHRLILREVPRRESELGLYWLRDIAEALGNAERLHNQILVFAHFSKLSGDEEMLAHPIQDITFMRCRHRTRRGCGDRVPLLASRKARSISISMYSAECTFLMLSPSGVLHIDLDDAQGEGVTFCTASRGWFHAVVGSSEM